MSKVIAVSLALILFVSSANAEELKAIFQKVDQFVGAKNYTKALEELSWAKKEIEKMHFKHLETFLPEDLAGYKGSKVESNSALGLSSVERTYTKAGNPNVKVSLAGGAGGAGGMFGGLVGLGQMAAMMEGQPGRESFRIGGHTASLDVQGSSAELSVFLSSGSILKLEMYDGANGDELKKMAEALNINGLEAYLQGTATQAAG